MIRCKVILLVASTLIFSSCNRHLSEVFFNDNSLASESEIFGDEFSEASPPIFFNIKHKIKLLDKYPFDKGGYAIVGLLSGSGTNDLQNEMAEFFTEDVNVLNDFKKAWTFTKETAVYACDYHYIIYVTHYGKVLESFAVNLNCNIIAAGQGYFYFDSKKLSQFKNRVKQLIPKYEIFPSIPEGRDYVSHIIKDKNLILAYHPIWLNFEGKFTFTFNDSDRKDDPEIVEKRVKSNIKKNFPNEPFQCSLLTYSTNGEYKFELTSNKSLFDQFNLYTKQKDWTLHEASLVTYWKG